MKRQSRHGKRPADGGDAVFVSDSGVSAHRQQFPLQGCFFPSCVWRNHPTRGHDTTFLPFFFFFFCVCACVRRFPKIPELNTCAGDELRGYSEAYDRIGSQKQLREANTWLHNGDRFWSWHALTHTASEAIVVVNASCSVNWHVRPTSGSGNRT